MVNAPDHCWTRRYSGKFEFCRVVGFSDHQDAWSLYSSAKDGEGWRPLQALGGAFEDPEEAKRSVDKAMAKDGYTAQGEWIREPMQGPFED